MVNVYNDPEEIYNLSAREEASLQRLVDSEKAGAETEEEKTALVEEELRKQRILEAESQRMLSRVLFITTDTAYLDPSAVEQKFGLYEQVFDEIHILVLHNHRKQKKEVQRPRKNIWLYNVSSRFLVTRIWKGGRYIKEQLRFGDEFRPDIIVALEPEESALLAEITAKKYDRPWQLHVLSKYELVPEFEAEEPGRLERMITKATITSAPNIKVKDEQTKEAVLQYKIKPDKVQVLPHFYNLSQFKNNSLTEEEQLFKQFKFTILYVGEVDNDSNLYQVLDAARNLLRTPSIGLAIIGTGPRLESLKERAQLFGVEKQLLQLSGETDLVKALLSADILVVPEEDKKKDELIIKAASLGTAVACAQNELRNTLFTDKESAFLYQAGDINDLQEKLKLFMNDNAIRTQIRTNAKLVIREQIVDDPQLYAIAYRNAIEDVLFAKEAAIEKESITKAVHTAQAGAKSKQATVRDIEGVAVKLPAKTT